MSEKPIGPIYSIRTSLGRELWWTTSRKKARELANDVNSSNGEHYITREGKIGGVLGRVQNYYNHELPLVVYRCSPVAFTVPEIRRVVRAAITKRKP